MGITYNSAWHIVSTWLDWWLLYYYENYDCYYYHLWCNVLSTGEVVTGSLMPWDREPILKRPISTHQVLLGLLLCITDHAKGFQRCIRHKVMDVNFILEAIGAIGGLIEMTRWVTRSDLYFRKIILESVWGMNWSKEWCSAGSQTRKQLLSGKGEQVWGNILGSGDYEICGQVRYEKSLHHEEIGCYYEGKPAGYLERAPKGGIPVVDPW